MADLNFGDMIGAGTGIFNAIGGLASNVANNILGFLNYNKDKDINQRNEQLMREAWARDDKARTRMVEDLENAGLSKWLGTGASPMTSSPISLQQEHLPTDMNLDALQHAFDNSQKFIQTKSNTDLQNKQGELADASTAVQEAEEKIKQEELNIKKQELRIKEHDADVWSNRPSVASNDPAPLRYIVEGSNLLTGNSDAGNGVRNWLDGFFSGQGTGNGEVTNPPIQPPSKQQKEIQKLKNKQAESDSKKGTTDDIFHPKFKTYEEWLNSQSFNKFYYEKHPKEAWKAYEAYLKRLK